MHPRLFEVAAEDIVRPASSGNRYIICPTSTQRGQRDDGAPASPAIAPAIGIKLVGVGQTSRGRCLALHFGRANKRLIAQTIGGDVRLHGQLIRRQQQHTAYQQQRPECPQPCADAPRRPIRPPISHVPIQITTKRTSGHYTGKSGIRGLGARD